MGDPPKATPMGGFALQKKPSTGSSYPTYNPCNSNWGWHGEWFYTRNPVETLFPAFTGGRPERRESWSWGPSHREKKVEIIEVELQKLMRHCLDGVWVFHTLYCHRVAPLVERAWPMWKYDGPSDPDRASSEELPNDEV